MATVTTKLVAGKTSSPYLFDTSIVKQLCKNAEKGSPVVFNPTYNVLGIVDIAPQIYGIAVNVQGVVGYTPVGNCACNTKSQIINEDFVISVFSTTAVTAAAIERLTLDNFIQANRCNVSYGNTFVSNSIIRLTVTTA